MTRGTVWLLDGNVLVALVLQGHIHHPNVTRWFNRLQGPIFATCLLTQGTLLRLHMTYAADRSASGAWATLQMLIDLPNHRYFDDAFPYSTVPHHHLQGAKQITDAWLAELSRRKGARLSTLDRGLAATHQDVAELIV